MAWLWIIQGLLVLLFLGGEMSKLIGVNYIGIGGRYTCSDSNGYGGGANVKRKGSVAIG